jgi:hypothetical protein
VMFISDAGERKRPRREALEIISKAPSLHA